jgi:hypothetical protein
MNETLKTLEDKEMLKIQRALILLGYRTLTVQRHISYNQTIITARKELPGDEEIKEILSKCVELDL